MIDFTLTERQKMLKEMAHDFAVNEIRPMAMAMDHEPDPAKGFAMAFEIAKKAMQLGFGKLRIPEEYGGMGMGFRDWAAAYEEIAWGDAGIATTISVSQGVAMQFVMDAREEHKKQWLLPYCEDTTGTFLFCGSMTEPAGGSEMVYPGDDIKLGMRDKAVLKGDEYVLNASRLFCTNAAVAKMLLISLRTDPNKRSWDSLADFVVPMDTPGVQVGKPFNLIGFRGSCQSEVVLDNVRLPKDCYFAPINIDWGAYMTGGMNLGIRGLAIARSAYEETLAYATDRQIWGMRLRDHDIVAAKLSEMRTKIEQTRALIYKIAWAMDNRDVNEGLHNYLAMPMISGARMAREVTADCLEILGTYGLTKECPVEKWLRDAQVVGMPDAGVNMQKIFMAKRL